MQALKQQHQRAVQQSQSQPGAPGQAPPQQQLLQPQQVQPVPSVGAPIQPPNKRQRTGPGMVASQPPYQAQSLPPQPGQPLGQPPGAPGQLQPVAPGYAYSQPGIKPAGPGSAPIPVQAAPGVNFQNGQMITPKFTGPKPQEDHTLINCFSIEQIETHIASLNNGLQLAPLKLKTTCLDVLKILQSHQHGWVFNSPVDPVELGLPDYFEVIKKPMDLGTIRKKLENGIYHSLEDFEGHCHLTFDNAMLYNPEGSVVYNMAKEMKDKLTADYEVMMKQLMIEEDQKRKNGEACLLCGCEKLQFEPPVFYCNGLNCPSKRIRRNSYYYVGGNNQYHWCHLCFQELKDNRPLELGDITIRKEALTKKKNDEVHEESWVQCDRCERWIHQICALFNTRQNKDQRSEYACPRCTIAERKKKGESEGTSSTPMAEDLQRTKLSEHLENHVRVKMNEHLDEEAKKKSLKDGIPLEDAVKLVEMGGAITIRLVTSMDKKLEVRERMKKRYAFKNYPDEFSYRCKCIVVFQNLDGVDVVLFGLYVYEHDEKNPAPNSRTVYVSYLDSVHYMRPRNMRTFIYHEILISYLDYVRQRGYSTAHIWACPPLKGDDYILYAKPEDQKTPRDDRLKQWYIDMLVECQRRGIVGTVTNMYDLYFSGKQNDATVVPYMDGDYFPAEVENIIKDIEEGKTGKKGNTQGKKKKNDKAKQKKKSGRGGTRSTGLDEEALKASGILTPGKDQKSLEEGGRDYVMVKLGETIHPMKESFLVAFLAWEGAREEDMVVPKEIQEYREQHGVEVRSFKKKEPKAEAKPLLLEDSKTPAESKTPAKSQLEDSKPVEPKPDDSKPDASMAEESKPDDSKTEESKTDESKPEHSKTEESKADESQVDEPKAEESRPDDSKTEESKKDDATTEDPNPDDSKPEGESDGGEKPPENSGEQKPTEDAEMKDSEPDEQKAEPEKQGEEGSNAEVKEEEPPADGSAPTDLPPSDVDAKPMDVDTREEESSQEQSEEKKDQSEEKKDELPIEDSKTAEPSTTTAPADAPSSTPPDGSSATAPVPADASSSDMQPVKVLPMEQRAGKFAAMARKRGRDDVDDSSSSKKGDEGEEQKEPEAEEQPKEEVSEELKAIYVTDSKGRKVKVVDDDDEEMDCEFLNNRQAFLNLCQGNHYQFDQLRRAKHSSMMVLWHLHNRDAPKFVQQCTTCSREILTGYRFHCPTCADFDQCQECVQNPKSPRHPHQLKPIPVAGPQTELTEAQRKERQRSIQLHMTLLLHAATCTSAKCPSANCTKMKGLLKHGAQCTQKATGGCNVCKRIWALLQIHARQCKATPCPVPNCMAIRERVRQLKKQQQAMDDRRRQEMNRVYRGAR
jgi:E1A/CREB-binding protein